MEVSLSRMRKEPWVFPDARSCRSASLRLMFLKNHLGGHGGQGEGWGAPALWGSVGCSRLLPGARTPPGRGCCSVPTHGSGSRLFTKATKLWGISPSWPVVSDCAFHHSPFLQGHSVVRPPRAAARTLHRAPGAAGVLGHPWNSLTLPGRGASPPSAAPGPRRAWARSCTGPPPACLGGQAEGRGGSGRFGGCHSHPTPRPGLTLHGGARRRRGLVGHQGVLNLGAVADQPLPGDRSPVSLSLCGIWPPRGHLWRCLAAGIGVCQPLLTWRLPSGSMG